MRRREADKALEGRNGQHERGELDAQTGLNIRGCLHARRLGRATFRRTRQFGRARRFGHARRSVTLGDSDAWWMWRGDPATLGDPKTLVNLDAPDEQGARERLDALDEQERVEHTR